jgi:hypothetical protein
VKRALVLLAVCTLLLAVTSQAQAPQGPPKPGPELKRLAYFVGTWKTAGEMKPGAFGPGGKMTSSDKAEWMKGGFFVVTHSQGTSSMGSGQEVSYTGYDPNEKVYTYHAFNSMGQTVTAKGTVTGDTWNWTSEEKAGGNTTSIKVTIKEVSKNEYTFKMELSQNGGAWSTLAESTSTRVTATAAPAKH